jgi:hypothetical protein
VSVFSKCIDIEDGMGGSTIISSPPLVYYYGYGTPMEKSRLYTRLIDTMSTVVMGKIGLNSEGIKKISLQELK